MKRIAVFLMAAVSLTARPAPRLLATAEDFARIADLAARAPWAAAARAAIVQNAANWPSAQMSRYGLKEWAVPPEGGQWTLWYVCPVHGVSLQFRGPGDNRCPIDNLNYTGWPYDQVIYMWRHSDNAAAARDNGLAYRLTGEVSHARAAARILLAYADVYNTYALKNTQGRDATSAGRVSAQTLDEAGWLIPIAWAYDLIADSGVLTPAERDHIEQDLLRAAAGVIQRNDAKQSNWQSWHNAALGAVGFALEDERLISRAIDGPSGFRFQMRASVQPDGAWYEGAWGYHFYALDPLVQLAEMAARADIDLYAEPNLRKMFEAPLMMAMPNLALPPFNDSGAVSLPAYDRLYELAWARYRDPAFGAVLGTRTRGREALLWGADEFPAAAGIPATGSVAFSDSGFVFLRAAASDHYLAMKFGPHGGGHGHYDKLGFMSYARGGIMAVDPGTVSYAAPTHNTWDKATVAHNTVVVDERTQAEATGSLLGFAALPAVSVARADAGPAYRDISLQRTMALTADYAVDIFEARAGDGREHRFDWVYHNYGRLTADLPLEPYSGFPNANGYQHLAGARAARTGEAWRADFQMTDWDASVGSIYASPAAVAGSMRVSREQAVSGSASARLGYDFRAAQGYLLFTIAAPSPQPRETPGTLSIMIYGDGSGHKLALRLYDSTDERFVYSVGTVNWTGWREIVTPDLRTWTSHYLGDADGEFDLPLKSVGVELTSAAGKPLEGALYVDDVAVTYAGAGRVRVADFDPTLRNLRLWMLGAPGTTVVAGEGLGPDLRVPVPFAMARRAGTEARFVALAEPYGEAPRVTQFRESDGVLVIAGEGWEDRLQFDGALRYVRRENGNPRRLALAGARSLEDLLSVEDSVPVQVDFSADGATAEVQTSGAGRVEFAGPSVRTVKLNGAEAEFALEGGRVILEAR